MTLLLMSRRLLPVLATALRAPAQTEAETRAPTLSRWTC